MSYISFHRLYGDWCHARHDKSDGDNSEEDYTGLFGFSTDESEYESIEWKQQLLESASCRRKFRIWEETQGLCIYCGKSITASDFINGIDSDIEHILPQALGGRTVLDNLVCSCRECNRAKGDLTAMDYMLSQSPEMISRYLIRLRLFAAAGLINARKYRALTTPKVLLTDS